MEELVEQHLGRVVGSVPGVTVAVLHDGNQHVFTLGTMAERRRPDDDCWEIASITKALTGTLLADMVLAGEVSLDDPIGRWLPPEIAGRLPTESRQPTLEDLATHHGGLPSFPWRWLPSARGGDPYSKLTVERVFDVLGWRTRRPLRRRFRYSNLGMGLLGHLLERAAASSYETMLVERVVRPLGMARAGVGGCGPDAGEAVPGYRKRKPTPPWTFAALGACGSVRATPTDMVALGRACLVPPPGRIGEALALAQTPRRKGPMSRHRIGLGWMIREHGDNRAVWHNGGTYGASSFFAADPGRGVAVALFGNVGPRLVPRLDAPGWSLLDEVAAL